MPGQSFAGIFDQLLPQNCVINTTPPTFAGISGTTPNTDGSITATWLAGTTSGKNPIEYEIFISLGVVSAAALFVSTNKVTISPSGTTSKKIFTLADQTTYLVNGQQYTMGVRAVDSQGYSETNTVIQTPTAIASGNLPVVYQTIATNLNTSVNTLNNISNTLAGSGGLTAEFEEREEITALFEDIEELI